MHNKIMSTYNNPPARTNPLASSSMFYPHSPNGNQQKSQYTPIASRGFRPTPDNSSSEMAYQPPPKAMTAQSAIFSPQGEGRPTVGGLNRLNSMARHVDLGQSQELPSQKRNSCDKAPFLRTGFPSKESSSYASQFFFPKSPTRSATSEEESTSIEFSEENRKRRESMDLEGVARKNGLQDERLRLMQRMKPFQPIMANQSRQAQKNDCESTNSGSGNELLKPKQFDFLKKKREQKEENSLGSNTFSCFNQQLKNSQCSKKPDFMWPLSISPMQQKFPRPSTHDTHSQPSSATKHEPSHPADVARNTLSNIEFKKKKLFDFPSSPQPNLNNQASRFAPNRGSHQQKTQEREDLTMPFNTLRNRQSGRPERQVGMDDFQIVSKLGKGAFGDVYMAMEKHLGLLCVLKKMSKKRIREAKVVEHIIRQIKLQSYLSHAHLTSLFGYFDDEENLYLVMELLPDGSLQQVKKKRKLPQKETAQIVKQVALGLKYMHQQYIIHRDLKPENLFCNEGYVKIGDFGCSIYNYQAGLRNTVVGCLEYSSPEQLSKEGYTDKIDSWSLGILTYELLFGKSPFQSDIKKMMIEGGKTELPEVVFPTCPAVSEDAKAIIRNLLDREPNSRMDMDEVLHHAFLREVDL